MAEGGRFQRSLRDSFSKASGDADESFCDPCKADDKWIATEGYCIVCKEYLCGTCLQVHRKQKITRAHVIFDKTQMPIGQRSVSHQTICVEVCRAHHPEIIRFYCKSHDEPGCIDCMTLNHMTCSRDRVQDISGGFQKSKEFKDIDQKLQQLHKEIHDMEGELDNNLKNLNTTYNDILHKIASVRKQINEYLDEIEKTIKTEAAQMQNEDETELKALHAENQAMKAEIEDMLQALHDSNVNVHSLFVITKQIKQRLVTMEREINQIKQPQQQQYEFLISNEIENVVSATIPLGILSRKSSQKDRDMTEKQDQRSPRAPIIDITATHNRSINVKGETDNDNCWINDGTLLGADRMVVTDGLNNSVKLIDLSSNTLISTHSTTSAPYGVTALSKHLVAVTLPKEGKIHVLNITSTITWQREINFNIRCFGIAYKDGKLAVSSVNPGTVDILDIQGKILHTLQPKQVEEYTLQCPSFITFGQDNDTVIVSDIITHKVSVLTFRGQILRTYTHDTLRDPRGIILTGDGVLFVYSWVSGCIHAISPDFKTSKIIINKDSFVKLPASITYCEINHMMYISNTHRGDLDNQIQVYGLNG